MAAPSTPTTADAVPSPEATPNDEESRNQTRQKRMATNQKMVQKYHAMFSKIPTMTSEELVERWKQIDKERDEHDDSQHSDDGDDNNDTNDNHNTNDIGAGPLLLIDVRSKPERELSMIQGAFAMDDLETIRWINKHVHRLGSSEHHGGSGNPAKPDQQHQQHRATPTIVTYCTIGYRSGREAQWLLDDLTSTYGIEVGSGPGNSVDIRNLDGILAYSFVPNAPPLLCPCHKGSSDSLMTRRIHSYGKEWSEAADPAFEVVYFDSTPQKAKHLLQTGAASLVRMVQHQIHKTTTKSK